MHAYMRMMFEACALYRSALELVGRHACVALQPDMEMATACAKPSHLAASSRPCLKASGYTCAHSAELTRFLVPLQQRCMASTQKWVKVRMLPVCYWIFTCKSQTEVTSTGLLLQRQNRPFDLQSAQVPVRVVRCWKARHTMQGFYPYKCKVGKC